MGQINICIGVSLTDEVFELNSQKRQISCSLEHFFQKKKLLTFEFYNIFKAKNRKRPIYICTDDLKKNTNFLLTYDMSHILLGFLFENTLKWTIFPFKFWHVLRILTLYYKMNRETMRALVKTEPTVGYEYKTDWPIRQPGECATVNYCRLRWKCSC